MALRTETTDSCESYWKTNKSHIQINKDYSDTKKTPTTERRRVKSPRKNVGGPETSGVREKRRHESEADADTQTTPIGKEVTTSPH